jgi:alpha-glucosidase (family GH31 glycosyl hydrolase)
MRSAFTYTPKYLNLFWLGDQLISYDAYDGMKTLIPAAISSGISGQSMIHSDIGGYNSFFTNTSIGMYYVRDQEILQRWSEFAAFGSSLFRTHIGSSMSTANAQIYDNSDSLQHFKKFASIFGNLSEYRFELMDIAIEKGHPLIRPMIAHYYYDPEVLLLPDPPTQYLFGSDFLISPSMTKGETENEIYIPAYSQFTHLWSGRIINTDSLGIWLSVPASLGYPNVLYKSNSIHGNALRQFVLENGYTNGYSWDYDNITNTTNHLILYIIISICILIVMIFTMIVYRMKHITNRRSKYEKLSISEILSPLADDDDKESINY